MSPLVESLLPQQTLGLDPCSYFGNLNKCVLAGPWLVEDDTAFVPTPVDTTMVIFNFIYLFCYEYIFLIAIYYFTDYITDLHRTNQRQISGEYSRNVGNEQSECFINIFS